MLDRPKVSVLEHGEALKQAYCNITGFIEGKLLADTDTGPAIELGDGRYQYGVKKRAIR
jgi:hypothetical protein